MKKGFTLVELLAVIVVLAILAVITVPVVLNLIGDSNRKLGDEQKLAVENAARAWGLKNLSIEDEHVIYNDVELNFIPIDLLQSSGALDNKKISGFDVNFETAGVCVSYDSNQLIYVFALSEEEC